MGVLSRTHGFPYIYQLQQEENRFPIDYLIETPPSTDNDEEDDQVIVSRRNQQTRRYSFEILSESPSKRRTQRLANISQIPSLNTTNKHRWGSRRLRRFENNTLAGLCIDLQDICDDLSDMLPDTTSAFSQLFQEAEKMQVWAEFVAKTENEQEAILCRRRLRKVKKSDAYSLASSPVKVACDQDIVLSVDRRYHKIDRNIRLVLLHKPASWARLHIVEAELRAFFNDNPSGVFLTVMQSGFERILLHASSQYLLLKSSSYDDPNGCRMTKIFNTTPTFSPPSEFLAVHLEKLTSSSGLN